MTTADMTSEQLIDRYDKASWPEREAITAELLARESDLTTLRQRVARLEGALRTVSDACEAMREAFLYHNPGGTTKAQHKTMVQADIAVSAARQALEPT